MDGRGNAGQPPCGQVTGCIYQVEKRTASSSAREKSEKCKSARCRAEGRSFHYERDRIRGGKACFHPQFHSKKILTLSAVIVLPFLVLSAVLLVSMSGYRRSYEEIVRNIAVANDYNLNFKEEMDESLYKLVVGYIDYEHIGDDPSLQDPYQMIGELKTEFTKLRDVTTEPESRWWLESLLRNIDTLEKRVDDILLNIQIGGRYDENIRELDNNIYILTELIQDNIQYYIYYQIRAMETVTGALNQQNPAVYHCLFCSGAGADSGYGGCGVSDHGKYSSTAPGAARYHAEDLCRRFQRQGPGELRG